MSFVFVPRRLAASAGSPAAARNLVLMLALTFSTGVIDAVGYLGLDRVFTGNMTGNVVILGMALLGADQLPIVGPVLALLGFMAGAAAGGRVLRQRPAGWTGPTTWLLAGVGALMLLLAAVLLVAEKPSTAVVYTVTGGLGAAMGLQAATARKVGVADVTTVVVTSTITALASDSRLGGGTGVAWARRLLAVVLILLGAAVGAGLLRWHVGAGLLLAAAVTLVVALVGHAGSRSDRTAGA